MVMGLVNISQALVESPKDCNKHKSCVPRPRTVILSFNKTIQINLPCTSHTLMPAPTPISIQTLCLAGWKASFQELCGVDHFNIIENLTREDDVLTQIILKTVFQKL